MPGDQAQMWPHEALSTTAMECVTPCVLHSRELPRWHFLGSPSQCPARMGHLVLLWSSGFLLAEAAEPGAVPKGVRGLQLLHHFCIASASLHQSPGCLSPARDR